MAISIAVGIPFFSLLKVTFSREELSLNLVLHANSVHIVQVAHFSRVATHLTYPFLIISFRKSPFPNCWIYQWRIRGFYISLRSPTSGSANALSRLSEGLNANIADNRVCPWWDHPGSWRGSIKKSSNGPQTDNGRGRKVLSQNCPRGCGCFNNGQLGR